MSMAAIRTTATLTDMGTAFRYVGSIAGTMQMTLKILLVQLRCYTMLDPVVVWLVLLLRGAFKLY